MNKYVLDTMALILYMEKRRVSADVKKIFEHFENGKAMFLIPFMVLVELAYLSEKSRIDTSLPEFESFLKKNDNKCSLLPLDFPYIKTAFKITDIPELHDRLISGVALNLDIPLITNDPIISRWKYMSQVIW